MPCIAKYALSVTTPLARVDQYSLSKATLRDTSNLESYTLSVTPVTGLLESYAHSATDVVVREYLEIFPLPGADIGDVENDPIVDPSDPLDGDAPFPMTTVDNTYTAAQCMVPDDEPRIRLNGLDITKYVQDINVAGSLGQQSTASIVLHDYDSDGFTELRSAFNPLVHSEIRAFHRDTPLARTLQVELKMGSTSPNYPLFIPGDPRSAADGTIKWDFTDLTPMINLDNQSVDGVDYDEGDDRTASSMIRELAALGGINNVICNFPDFVLRTFRFSQGNVMNAIDELASYTQSYRRFKGSTLEIAPLMRGITSGAGTHLTDRFHLPNDGGFEVGYDTSGLKTFFRITRMAPLATTLSAPVDCTGGQCVGRVVRIDFDTPVTHAFILPTARDGEIRDGVFHAEDGEPLNSLPSFRFFGTSVSKKAKYWIGTYFPRFTRTEKYIPYWRIEAHGGYNRNTDEDEFRLNRAVLAAEILFGRRPEYKNLESDVILKQATARAMLDAIVTEVEWGVITGSITTPFLTKELAGDMIRVSDYQNSLSGRSFIVSGYQHRWNPSDGYSNTLNLRGKLGG